MVEFGLKLEDNKVEEWQDKYINYEELKTLIKNAKKAYSARQELEKRNPSMAAEIRAKMNDSSSSLNNIVEEDESQDATPKEGPAGEKMMLLYDSSRNVNKYGSHADSSTSQKDMVKSDSSNSLGKFFKGVKKGINFSYKGKVLDAIAEESLAMDKFSIVIFTEVSKVNGFYRGIAEEMEERLDFLRDEAGLTYKFAKKKKQPLANMRKSLQIRMSMLSRTGSIIGPSESNDNGYDSDDEEFERGASPSMRQKQKDKAKEADSIKRAMTDMHRRAKLLNNFAIINSTGFVKIIKKFNKQFPHKKDDFKEIVEDGYICGEGKRVVGLISRMERYYADWFCGGNETEARSLMLPKKGDGLDMDWSQLRLGYRLGMCSILMIWVAWDCVWGYVEDGHTTIGGRTAFPVFRACGGLLLVHWFWGISVYVWNRYRINYIFLFDFDPRIVDTPITIFEDATDESLVFFILMLLYYKSGAEAIPDVMPPGCYAFLLVLYTIKSLVFPLKTRRPLWRAIFSVLTAPITAPTLFHTYIADVFTSMVKVFQDILWTGCFVVSGDFMLSETDPGMLKTQIWEQSMWYRNIVIPLICLFPLWIRFNQCLRRYMDTRMRMPNLANAFKYALAQSVTLFGAFHPLYLMHKHHRNISDDLLVDVIDNSAPNIFDIFWFCIFVSSSLYSYCWDVYFDWGLGRPKHGFLGTRLMFPKKMHYYYVMAADLFLRFMWVTTLIPPSSGAKFQIPNYLTFLTMAMELIRRTIWGFFRIEHEHRHNTSGFRRVDFVPLHFSTGHDHKYKRKEHVGWSVLGEVTIISAIVVTISVASVIAAQKATAGISLHDQSGKDL